MSQLTGPEQLELVSILKKYVRDVQQLNFILVHSDLGRVNYHVGQTLPDILSSIILDFSNQHRVIPLVEAVLAYPDGLNGNCPPIQRWLDTVGPNNAKAHSSRVKTEIDRPKNAAAIYNAHEAHYLRKRLAEAAKDKDLDTLVAMLPDLRTIDSEAADLFYYQALLAQLRFQNGCSYNSSTKERVLKEWQHNLEVAIEAITTYTDSAPQDENGWLLRAEIERDQHAPGWASRCIEALTKAIEINPTRVDWQFYRGEIVARLFEPSQLSDGVIRAAIEDLSVYLREDLSHARGYRLLAHLYTSWEAKLPQASAAAEISQRLADCADGHWRRPFGRYGAWGLLISCFVGVVSYFIFPRLGAQTLSSALFSVSYLAAAYCILLLAAAFPSGHSIAGLFDIDSRDEHLYEPLGWMEAVLPPRPDVTKLRASLDAIERELKID